MNAKDNVQRNRKLEVEKQKKKEAELELQREKELVFPFCHTDFAHIRKKQMISRGFSILKMKHLFHLNNKQQRQ